MDDDFNDWELDDWEYEAFDEDIYDQHEIGLSNDAPAATLDDVDEGDLFPAPWPAAAGGDPNADWSEGAGPVVAEAATRTGTGEARMGWSAWDVGTVFALGGWLADHHADRTAQQVAAALAEHNTGRPASGTPLGATRPPPPSNYPYQRAVGTLSVGSAVDQGPLYAELARAEAHGQDLMIQADGPADLDRPLVLIISAVPWSSGPRFWVVAEEHRGGFSATRLIPVFERSADNGVAIFATDHASEAVDAALWASTREGVPLHEFRVTHRQPE